VLLERETKAQAKDVREKYKETIDHTWIQKIMKNPNYSVIDNEGVGQVNYPCSENRTIAVITEHKGIYH
jgi:hypothetical protein